MRKKPLNKFIRYVSPAEMAEINSDKKLLKRLKAGHKDAKALRGKLISLLGLENYTELGYTKVRK